MEDADYAGKHAVCEQSVSDAHLLGLEIAADFVAAGAAADASPETLATVLEAVATQLAYQAAVLRRGRVR